MTRWKTFNWGEDDDDTIPKSPGVYVMYLDGKLSYVGSSQNLRIRCADHIRFRQRYSSNITTPWGMYGDVKTKYRLSERLGDWLMHEHRLICRLQPPCNVRHVNKKQKV